MFTYFDYMKQRFKFAKTQEAAQKLEEQSREIAMKLALTKQKEQ